MAMTKKERADFDAAIDKIQLLGALRFTTPVEQDVPVPTTNSGFASGWDFNSYERGRVWLGWSDSTGHGSGPIPIDKVYRSGSQGARCMFSTKAKALAAMRNEMEQRFASILAAIDRQIQESL